MRYSLLSLSGYCPTGLAASRRSGWQISPCLLNANFTGYQVYYLCVRLILRGEPHTQLECHRPWSWFSRSIVTTFRSADTYLWTTDQLTRRHWLNSFKKRDSSYFGSCQLLAWSSNPASYLSWSHCRDSGSVGFPCSPLSLLRSKAMFAT